MSNALSEMWPKDLAHITIRLKHVSIRGFDEFDVPMRKPSYFFLTREPVYEGTLFKPTTYLTTWLLFTPFYFIACIPPMRTIVYNSYAISHLIITIIIIIQSPRKYYTNIFTTQYNFTYTHCNSCPPYTFTNQILTHSLQLAAMISCPTVNETIVYTFVTHFRYN